MCRVSKCHVRTLRCERRLVCFSRTFGYYRPSAGYVSPRPACRWRAFSGPRRSCPCDTRAPVVLSGDVLGCSAEAVEVRSPVASVAGVFVGRPHSDSGGTFEGVVGISCRHWVVGVGTLSGSPLPETGDPVRVLGRPSVVRVGTSGVGPRRCRRPSYVGAPLKVLPTVSTCLACRLRKSYRLRAWGFGWRTD